jgi:serine/threonine protein kinase
MSTVPPPFGDRVKDALLEIGDSADRAAALDDVCGSDDVLRKAVESLLAAQDQAGRFLAGPTVGPPLAETSAPTLATGEVIGPYTLLRIVGEGGFGVVYEAQQRVPVRRTVALKLIKVGLDTADFVKRFKQERQTLAMMDHPCIAQMYDAGSTPTGRPYLVMEFVAGSPLTTFADENRLTLPQRLQLFRDVCAAIDHAHTKAIIHRDIKSSNVLAYFRDGKPAVKVIDFGIAKAVGANRISDHTVRTEHGRAIGTYDAMSPEQAAGSSDIDTRADVYALGMLLYELLAGCKPFQFRGTGVGAVDEICRVIREVDAPRPSTRLGSADVRVGDISRSRQLEPGRLIRHLRDELEWIPLKAIRKNRAERYASVAELDADVERYLQGRPLVAGPDTVSYRAAKFVRLYRGPLVASAAALLAVVVGVAFYVSGIRTERQRADAERDFAEVARAQAERGEKVARRAAARSEARYLIQENLLPAAMERARDAWRLGATWEDGFTVDQVSKRARRNWQLAARIPVSDVRMACYAGKDASEYLVVARNDDLNVFHATTGAMIAHVPTEPAAPTVLKLVANVALGSITVVRADRVERYDLPSLNKVASSRVDDAHFAAVNDKQLLLIDTAGNVRLLALADFAEIESLPFAQQAAALPGIATPRRGALSPSGDRVVLQGSIWSKPSTYWSRGAQRPLLRRIDLRSSETHFIDENRIATWFVPDITGNAASDSTVYDLSNLAKPGSMPTAVYLRTIMADDIKSRREMQVWPTVDGDVRIGLAGSTGSVETGYGRPEERGRPLRESAAGREDRTPVPVCRICPRPPRLATAGRGSTFSAVSGATRHGVRPGLQRGGVWRRHVGGRSRRHPQQRASCAAAVRRRRA